MCPKLIANSVFGRQMFKDCFNVCQDLVAWESFTCRRQMRAVRGGRRFHLVTCEKKASVPGYQKAVLSALARCSVSHRKQTADRVNKSQPTQRHLAAVSTLLLIDLGKRRPSRADCF